MMHNGFEGEWTNGAYVVVPVTTATTDLLGVLYIGELRYFRLSVHENIAGADITMHPSNSMQ